MIHIRLFRNKMRLLFAPVAMALAVLLLHVRYVCDPAQERRALTFAVFFLILSIPCFFLVLKILFPKPFNVIGLIFYILLALFPYKFFFPSQTDLCTINTDPSLTLHFGLPRYFGLLAYGLVSCLLGCWWMSHQNPRWWRHLPLRDIGICGVLFLLTVVQIAPRLVENSVLLVMDGIHRDKERCHAGTSYTLYFFGQCDGGDSAHWLRPNGIFKGVHLSDFMLIKIKRLKNAGIPDELVEQLQPLGSREFDTREELLAEIEALIGPEQTRTYQEILVKAFFNGAGYKVLVANRRMFTSYLYSLFEPFTHPYFGAIILNGLVMYMILMAAYRLALVLNLPPSVALAYPILLSSHHRLLQWATETAFYTPKLAFALLILLIGTIFQIYSRPVSLINQALFCTMLACSALVYDPPINIGFLLLWGALHAVSQARTNLLDAGRTLLKAVMYGMIPQLAQDAFEVMLAHYDLMGMVSEHANASEDLLKQLYLLPSFLWQNGISAILKINTDLTQVLFTNALTEEYLSVLGGFGVICFFSLLFRYLQSDDLKGIYAIYFSAICVQVIASFIAQIPPATYSWLAWTGPQRPGGVLPALVLAQSIGLYHFAKIGSRWIGGEWVTPRPLYYGVVLFIFLFSYHHILALY